MKNMDWIEMTLVHLEAAESGLNDKDKKLYKTDKLRLMIRCVGVYSKKGCHDCVIYQDTLERMVLSISRKGLHDIKEYRNLYSLVLKHLVNSHELIQEGKYLSTFIFAGMILGALVGLLQFNSVGIGISTGLASGVVVGSVFESRAKRSGVQI